MNSGGFISFTFMQVKTKHLFSLLILGVFLVMALASEFLDESTNTSVGIKPGDCQGRPPFTGKLKVVLQNTGQVLMGPTWLVEINLTDQKINDTINCTSFYQAKIVTQEILSPGFSITYTSPDFTHDNKSDLWRVAVRAKIVGTDDWTNQEVKVAFYDQTMLTFNINTLPHL